MLVALASLIASRPSAAEAHQVGLSQGLYRVVAGGDPAGGGESVSVTLTLARGELRNLAREVDQDRDGEVSEVEVMLGATAIEAAIVDGLAIAIDERSCTPRFDGASLTEEDGLEIALRYACPPIRDTARTGAGDEPQRADAEPPRALAAGESDGPSLRIDLSALVALGGAHRHIARIIPPGSEEVRAERVLHRLRPRAQLSLAPAKTPATPPARPPEPAPAPEPADSLADELTPRAEAAGADPATANDREPDPATPPVDRELAAYFTLGVEHILSGVDHLVFLLGLMIAGGRLREWALMITAFTVGHSASLALATLELWTPPSSIIEPLIAASIVYIGLENLLRADPAALRRRWRLTLPFGFVHGFGFAGALAEVGISGNDGAVAWVLALFNLGVEVGQLAALATMAMVLRAVPQLSGTAAKRSISAAIALAGLAWLISRVL